MVVSTSEVQLAETVDDKDSTFALQHYLNRKRCLEVERRLDDLIKNFGKLHVPFSCRADLELRPVRVP